MLKKQFILLVNKYLTGTATDSEKQLVETYLTNLESSSTAKEASSEVALRQAMWQHIQAYTVQPQAVPVNHSNWYQTKALRVMAIAASLAGLIGLAFYLFNRPIQVPQVVQNSSKTEFAPIIQRIANTTGEDERFQLPDSSWVVLATKSEVTYEEPFIKRNITLNGKAGFKVTKDATRPFTVRSGAVSTTVLGTEFLVNAFEKSKQLTVRLYEGKVVVKATNKSDWRMKKDFYLEPGEEFIYNDKALARVRSFKKTPQNSADQENTVFADDPFIPQNTKGSWYMFNNQKLKQVFDQLSFTYDVPIVYDSKDLQNKYFVGRFKKEDSLEVILKYITIVNKLKLVKKENTYYIIK